MYPWVTIAWEPDIKGKLLCSAAYSTTEAQVSVNKLALETSGETAGAGLSGASA
jgi:hypothetical protein